MKMSETNFWQTIKKPVLALAPMAGFTDISFREICSDFGADVVYSEMASAAALYYAKDISAGNPTLQLLEKGNGDRRAKYVVQIFGSEPEHFAVAARIVTENIVPNGIDINFGCPVSKVLKQGAGSDLMNNLPLARKVISATIANTDLPVSVKIRTKSGETGAIDFLDNISDLGISAVMIHGRSVRQGFVGEIDCGLIKEAREHFSGIILANGGINNLVDAERILADTGADGLGLARGALSRPQLFREIRTGREEKNNLDEILSLIAKHAKLVYKYRGDRGFIDLRKQLCWYVQGISGASRLREKFIAVSSFADLKKIISDFSQ
jgi:nifR3 family TIM-barrel protein